MYKDVEETTEKAEPETELRKEKRSGEKKVTFFLLMCPSLECQSKVLFSFGIAALTSPLTTDP